MLAKNAGRRGEVEGGRWAATALLDLSDVLLIDDVFLAFEPPYCLRAAAPGSDGLMMFGRNAGSCGLDGPDRTESTEELFRTGAETSLIDSMVGDGRSRGEIHFIAVALGKSPLGSERSRNMLLNSRVPSAQSIGL